LKNSGRLFKFEVPNLKWRGQVAPVVVENAETLDKNEYSIPSKEPKREWSNVLKSIGVTGVGVFRAWQSVTMSL